MVINALCWVSRDIATKDQELAMQTKIPFLQELKGEYKRYFESSLAALVMEYPLAEAISIKKISQAIAELLMNHQEKAIWLIQQKPKIQEELYHKEFFGHLKLNKEPTPLNIFHHIVDTLQNHFLSIHQALHLHAIFIQRFYDHICSAEELAYKNQLCKKIFSESLFSDRARKELKTENKFVKTIGINQCIFFRKKIHIHTEEHSSAIYKFIPNKESDFFKSFYSDEFEFVAGPSGHMGYFILGSLVYGHLNNEEMKEYLFFCAMNLINGGNHTLKECLIVMQQMGHDYQNYEAIIPIKVKNSIRYQYFIEKFSEFLEEPLDFFNSNTKEIKL